LPPPFSLDKEITREQGDDQPGGDQPRGAKTLGPAAPLLPQKISQKDSLLFRFVLITRFVRNSLIPKNGFEQYIYDYIFVDSIFQKV
jgi:hypothetical protein